MTMALRMPAGCGGRMPALQPALLQYAVVQFFLAPVGGGLHEGQNDGVRLLFGGRQLRLEERGQEKTVRRRFDRADFALGAARHYGESRFHGRPFKVRIDFEVAEVLFGRGLFSLSVKRLQVGAGTQANLRDCAGWLRGVALGIGPGTGDRIDVDVLRAGIVLGAVGVWDVEDVAGEFDEGVLESSAGAEEREQARVREA